MPFAASSAIERRPCWSPRQDGRPADDWTCCSDSSRDGQPPESVDVSGLRSGSKKPDTTSADWTKAAFPSRCARRVAERGKTDGRLLSFDASATDVTLEHPPDEDLTVTDAHGGPVNVTQQLAGVINVTQQQFVGLFSVTPLDLSAPLLQNLLHATSGVEQAHDGRYGGPLCALDEAKLTLHLSGELTIAFPALDNERALFGAVDIDNNFEWSAAYIANAAWEIGGEEFLSATWFTTGSREGRGKALLSFKKPCDSWAASTLITALVKRASERAILKTDKVYPQRGQGGLLRVLGRKRPYSNSAAEFAFTFSRAPRLNGTVVPMHPGAVQTLANSLAIRPPRPSRRMKRLREAVLETAPRN